MNTMQGDNLSIRESTVNDFEKIINYFHASGEEHLLRMGVDASKLPERTAWLQLLKDEQEQSMENKKFFFVTWLLANTPVGHSSITKIIFGEEAYMHLHIWEAGKRQKGNGTKFVALSLPPYFKNFKLKKLYCEPNALNPSPNSTLKNLAFDFIQQHETTPGYLNFHQPVNKWCLDFEKFKLLYGSKI